MKSILTFSAACILASTSVFAESASTLNQSYVYGGVGTIGIEVKNKSDGLTEDVTPNLSLGFGHEFSEHVALETFVNFSSSEYSNEWNPYDNGKVEFSLSQFGVSFVPSTAELGNSGIKLYARLNASFAKVEAEASGMGFYNTSYSDTGLMIDGGAGIQWNVNQNFMLRGEYITNLADTSFDDDFGDVFDYQGFQVALGYRF